PGFDQMDVWQVERGEVFVVESRPFAAIRVVRLPRRPRLRVLDDRVDARPDLLHDAEVGIELLLGQLLRGQLTVVFPWLLDVLNLAREIIVVGLDGSATGRYL